MSEKLQKAYELYKTTFNDDFPTIPLAESLTDTEIIEMINECVEENKDVYDLGYLQLDDIEYQKAKVQIYTPLLFSWLYDDYMRSQTQINVN